MTPRSRNRGRIHSARSMPVDSVGLRRAEQGSFGTQRAPERFAVGRASVLGSILGLVTGLVLVSGCHIEPDRPISAGNGNVETLSIPIPAVIDTLEVRIFTPSGHLRPKSRNYNDEDQDDDEDEEHDDNLLPVAYVLGNGEYFDIAADYASGLDTPLMVVGLGYGRKDRRKPACLTDEYRDYTPKPTTPAAQACAAGQADGFYQFLKNKLMPELEQKFGADPTRRTLIGHDLGALFVAHVGFGHGRDADFPFAMLVAGDTPLGYDEGALLRREKALFDDFPQDRRLPINMRVLQGGLSDPARFAYFLELDARIKFHQLIGFDYASEVIEDADDWEMRYTTVEKGIAVAGKI